MELNTGIYKITNKINNKFYFGSTTISFKNRWSSHIVYLNRNKHRNIHLQNAWNKYGAEHFDFSIILVCNAIDCLYYEQLFLDRYWDNCINCYNINPNAKNSIGVKRSKEACENIRKSKLGNSNRLGTKTSQVGLQNIHIAQTLAKIKNTGTKRSEQVCKNISNAMLGNKNGIGNKSSTGKKVSLETRNKMSISSKGKCSGEDSVHAKVTWVKADYIRSKYFSTKCEQKLLAIELGLSCATINNIIRNKTWVR